MVCSHEHPEDFLWRETNADLGALMHIVCSHFQSPDCTQTPLGEGCYVRAFLFTLQHKRQVVARVILPVRETLKTEAEIAAMDCIRARTKIPIPKVYLYCSTPDNPVRAEWILMEYLPGVQMADGFDNLTYEQKRRTADDLANILSTTFSITAIHCGSMMRDYSIDDDDRTPRFNPSTKLCHPFVDSVSDAGRFQLGPVNEITLLEIPRQVPAAASGPFDSERLFLEAFAWRGIPGMKPHGKLARGPFERVFNVYEAVRPLYPDVPEISKISDGSHQLFHFAHGDLSTANILIDPESGAITGVIDWEMSGFYPSWCASHSGTFFNDDSRRFLLDDLQEKPEGYDDETSEDAELRKYFLSQLASLNPELYRHDRDGVELRAIFYNLCIDVPANVASWIPMYEEYHWDATVRGKFPIDCLAHMEERWKLWEGMRPALF